MHCKTNFVCVGAQKSGTTSLHSWLNQIPEIGLPRAKESKHFLYSRLYSRGLEDRLREDFDLLGPERVIGEVDPDYMHISIVPKRLFETHGGDLKLIFLLRNPIERAYSHYKMMKFVGLERSSFREAIELESTRLDVDDLELEARSAWVNFSYIERGRYAKHLSNYLNYFDPKNFLILDFDKDLVISPEDTLRKILKFIGVKNEEVVVDLHLRNAALRYKSATFSKFLRGEGGIKNLIKPLLPLKLRKKLKDSMIELNSSRDRSALDLQARGDLVSIFDADINRLEQLTGTSFEHWRRIAD